MVSQDIILFDDTVRANIAYAKSGASDEEIRKACDFAAAADFIDNLPQSYETIIDTYDNDDTLFYCDPPYFKMEDYYVQDFQRHQHKELAEKLKSIKGKFVLSYYDFPDLETWFPKHEYFWIENW